MSKTPEISQKNDREGKIKTLVSQFAELVNPQFFKPQNTKDAASWVTSLELAGQYSRAAQQLGLEIDPNLVEGVFDLAKEPKYKVSYSTEQPIGQQFLLEQIFHPEYSEGALISLLFTLHEGDIPVGLVPKIVKNAVEHSGANQAIPKLLDIIAEFPNREVMLPEIFKFDPKLISLDDMYQIKDLPVFQQDPRAKDFLVGLEYRKLASIAYKHGHLTEGDYHVQQSAAIFKTDLVDEQLFIAQSAFSKEFPQNPNKRIEFISHILNTIKSDIVRYQSYKDTDFLPLAQDHFETFTRHFKQVLRIPVGPQIWEEVLTSHPEILREYATAVRHRFELQDTSYDLKQYADDLYPAIAFSLFQDSKPLADELSQSLLALCTSGESYHKDADAVIKPIAEIYALLDRRDYNATPLATPNEVLEYVSSIYYCSAFSLIKGISNNYISIKYVEDLQSHLKKLMEKNNTQFLAQSPQFLSTLYQRHIVDAIRINNVKLANTLWRNTNLLTPEKIKTIIQLAALLNESNTTKLY